jgi:hypothetical protein
MFKNKHISNPAQPCFFISDKCYSLVVFALLYVWDVYLHQLHFLLDGKWFKKKTNTSLVLWGWAKWNWCLAQEKRMCGRNFVMKNFNSVWYVLWNFNEEVPVVMKFMNRCMSFIWMRMRVPSQKTWHCCESMIWPLSELLHVHGPHCFSVLKLGA